MGVSGHAPEMPVTSRQVDVCPFNRVDNQLVTRQQQPETDVGIIYKAVQDKRVMSAEEVGCRGGELKKLAKLLPMMHL